MRKNFVSFVRPRLIARIALSFPLRLSFFLPRVYRVLRIVRIFASDVNERRRELGSW